MRKWLTSIAYLVPAAFLSATAPAFAQSSSAGDAAAGLLGLGFGTIWCCCYGLLGLLGLAFFVLWVVMLIDVIQRDTMEFPNAGENTKTIWLVILLASWIVSLWWLSAIIYYFMVYRAMPRSKTKARPPSQPPASPPQPPPAPPSPPAGGA